MTSSSLSSPNYYVINCSVYLAREGTQAFRELTGLELISFVLYQRNVSRRNYSREFRQIRITVREDACRVIGSLGMSLVFGFPLCILFNYNDMDIKSGLHS